MFTTVAQIFHQEVDMGLVDHQLSGIAYLTKPVIGPRNEWLGGARDKLQFKGWQIAYFKTFI